MKTETLFDRTSRHCVSEGWMVAVGVEWADPADGDRETARAWDKAIRELRGAWEKIKVRYAW